MTDDSRTPFILPDSVLKRRGGLLGSAMPEAQPHQWAEHLELLTADGKLTSVADMLGLMRSELDRLQKQIDSEDEPDMHSEMVLAAAMAEMLDEKPAQKQLYGHREVYFALLLGYLYGRLTKPGKKTMRENAAVHIRDYQAQIKRRQGGQINAESKRFEAAERMAEAKQIWDELIRAGRAEHGLPQIVQDRLAGRGVHVSVDTVARWARIGGWRSNTKKRMK
ncbi:MAG: hypothetical protein U5L98_18300 [Halomonas sp.]|uniref:hypothetical protein n=1 Tax=Halomonas sp. TaxID=1486246 RepID=UPI002ACDD5F8|nr:hypothetical protein [Halomonas sp.]MDZ7854525.1 hypothetical protein [Halomonas sp.]